MVTAAIALCRELWPAVTTAAASDAFLTAWYDDVQGMAGEVYFGTDTLLARAHLLAHQAYRVDPAGLLGGGSGVGPVQSVTTSRRSVSYGTAAGVQSATLGDADLATTKPGLAYLRLRERRPSRLPTVITP